MTKKKHKRNKKSAQIIPEKQPQPQETKPAGVAGINTLTDLWNFLKQNKILILLLMGIILSVYVMLLFADFVSADDLNGYVRNPVIRDFKSVFETRRFEVLDYAIFYHVFGPNPLPLHIRSILLHMVNTVLVMVLAYMLFGKRISLYSSFLFAVHPVNAEAVSWISGNGYLHNGLIIFTSLILYLLYNNSKKLMYLIFSLAIFTVGMFFRYQGLWLITIPLVIFVINQYLMKKKPAIQNFLLVSLYLALSIIFAVTNVIFKAQQRISALATQYDFDYTKSAPWFNRLPYSIYMTAKLLIFPKELSLFHEGQVIPTAVYAFMVIFTIALAISLLILWKKNKTVFALISIILVSTAPIYSPIQVAFFTAERYIYVSAAFYCMLLAYILIWAADRYKNKNVAAFAVLALITIFSLRTFMRTLDWQSSRTLWESNAKTAPGSARVFNNLGDAYSTEKNYQGAVSAFSRAIAINPTYTDAMHNLGLTYIEMGNYEEAKKLFLKALELDPNYAGAQTANQILLELQKRNL